MNRYLTCLSLFVFISDAYAETSWYVQNTLTAFDERNSSFEEASFSLPDVVNNTAIGVSGEKFGINYRLRVENESGFDPSSSDQNIILQELSRDFVFNNGVIINVGKTQIHLDEGINSQPLGFFQRDITLNDVVDEQDESEGLPLIALNYLSENWNGSIILSDDFESDPDGFNRGLKQAALQFSCTQKWGEVGVVFQKPEKQDLGVGAFGNFNLSSTTVAYFSFFGREGTLRPFYQILEGDSDLVVGDPFLSSRLNDEEFYERYNIGVRSTYKGVDFTIEYSFDERGLDRNQWRRYLDLINIHNDLAISEGNVQNTDAGRLHLSFDREVLRRSDARQKYALFYISKPFEYFSASFFTRYEIDSNGIFSGVTLSYPHHDQISFSASLSHLGGQKNSEFRINENSAILEFFVKYLF